MKNNKIIQAYESIKPDEEAKERMLKNIISGRQKITKHEDWRRYNMKKRFILAAVIAALITATSGSIYATYKWHEASEAAQFIGDDKLTKAFGKTTQDIQVEESGKYRIAFLGTVSGKNISDEVLDGQDSGQTYAAVAVEKTDGTPMDYDSGLVISPLIQGLDPKEYNIYGMGGDASSIIKDGVLYCIASCKDIQMFADKELYLAVTEGPVYLEAYNFDKDTGKIAKVADYKGVNCLFKLPIDSALADKAKAEKYVKEFEKNIEDSKTNTANTTPNPNSDSIVDRVIGAGVGNTKNIDKIKACGKCFYTVKEKPDKDGNINVSYQTEKYGGASGTIIPVFDYSKAIVTGIHGSYDYVVIEICTLNDDKTVTLEEYAFDKEHAEKLLELIKAK